LFGLACGYAAYAWFAGRAQEPVLGLEAAATFVLGYVLSMRGLSSIQPEPRKVPVPIFDVREVEPMAPVERPALERVRPSAEVAREAQPVAETPVTIAEPIAETVTPAEPVAEMPIAPDQLVAETAVPREAEHVAEGPITQPVEATIGAPSEPAEPVEEFGAADSLELELNDAADPEVESPQASSDPEIGVDEGAQGARVVHLFDPASMPTPEEMISRIDRHLEGQPSAAQSADAAQALHQALAELRRSIR
jgi:hypothetical protein